MTAERKHQFQGDPNKDDDGAKAEGKDNQQRTGSHRGQQEHCDAYHGGPSQYSADGQQPGNAQQGKDPFPGKLPHLFEARPPVEDGTGDRDCQNTLKDRPEESKQQRDPEGSRHNGENRAHGFSEFSPGVH